MVNSNKNSITNIVIGIDLSVNHLAAVVANDFSSAMCVGPKKYTKMDKRVIELLSRKKNEDLDNYAERRKIVVASLLTSFVNAYTAEFANVYVCLENYAFMSASRAMTPLAEMMGVIKTDLYTYGAKIRLHDPLSVKKFATGKGNATKLEMINAAIDDGYSINKDLYEIIERTVRKQRVPDADGPGTDLADAYWLSQMLSTELAVRAGHTTLEQLEERKREIFLRVTKSNPVNLLARPFIERTL